MTNEQQKAFEEYEQLKIEIREREARLEILKPIILPLVPEDKEMLTEKGYFYIQKKSKWKYSKELENKEKDLKKEKKREEAEGIAEVEYTPVLYYKTGIPEEKEE